MGFCHSMFCAVLLMPVLQMRDSPQATREPWGRIRLLEEKGTAHGNPELLNYLKSLTAEEMLTAARQASREAEAHAGPYSDTPRIAAANLAVSLCLQYYTDKWEHPADGVRRVLKVLNDADESPLLRHAILELMSCSPFNPFVEELRAYASAHLPEVDRLLSSIVKNKREDPGLRDAAMFALGAILEDKVRLACLSDANVRAESKRTGKVVRVGELVRSGELSLAETTWKALKPIEERILANAKLLSAIMQDQKNEPETLRARARVRLKAYRRLPLVQVDEIDRILQRSNE